MAESSPDATGFDAEAYADQASLLLGIDLDPAFFKLLDDFEARFPGGPPSLAACERLTVRGDVEFGAHVAVRGAAEVIHTGPGRLRISDGTVL